MHLDELVGEDCVDRSLVVDVARKAYVDIVGADVGVLGRVYTREVLVFEMEISYLDLALKGFVGLGGALGGRGR